MADLNAKKTQPSKSEIITVESKFGHALKSDADHPKVGDLCDSGRDGYCLCCVCGFCFPLITACCLGQDMGDKWALCKYGIPGKLNKNKKFSGSRTLLEWNLSTLVFICPNRPYMSLNYLFYPNFQCKALLLTVYIYLMYFFAVNRYFYLDEISINLIVRISVLITVTAILFYQRRYVSYNWSLINNDARLQI